MLLLIIAENVEQAELFQKAGVDIIFFDLETLGKKSRQKGLNSFITKNKITSLPRFRKVINKSKLLVRVNPINSNSAEEIKTVLESKPDIIMLPMVKTADEVIIFDNLVSDKAEKLIMIETSESLEKVDEIIKASKNSDFFIGLNDLHLSLGMSFMFEPLSNGIIEHLSDIFNASNIKFGFGGIAKLGEGLLSSKLILSEHIRLGSSFVILSKSYKENTSNKNFDIEIKKIREHIQLLKSSPKTLLDDNKHELINQVNKIIND